MVSITLSVPPDLKGEMDSHPEINWSEVARQAIRSKMDVLRKVEEIERKARKSKIA